MFAKYFVPRIDPNGSFVLSSGVIDTGAWDTMGEEGKRAYFEHVSGSNPARRIGTPEDWPMPCCSR